MPIYFHYQSGKKIKFLQHRMRLWLHAVARSNKKEINEINYVFMSDDDLLQMNRDFLNHDYYTDIITFDNASLTQKKQKKIVADIFISTDRIFENAKQLNLSTNQEFCRVSVHGLLHLCGYADKTKADAIMMRKQEDYYLALVKQ